MIHYCMHTSIFVDFNLYISWPYICKPYRHGPHPATAIRISSPPCSLEWCALARAALCPPGRQHGMRLCVGMGRMVDPLTGMRGLRSSQGWGRLAVPSTRGLPCCCLLLPASGIPLYLTVSVTWPSVLDCNPCHGTNFPDSQTFMPCALAFTLLFDGSHTFVPWLSHI